MRRSTRIGASENRAPSGTGARPTRGVSLPTTMQSTTQTGKRPPVTTEDTAEPSADNQYTVDDETEIVVRPRYYSGSGGRIFHLRDCDVTRPQPRCQFAQSNKETDWKPTTRGEFDDGARLCQHCNPNIEARIPDQPSTSLPALLAREDVTSVDDVYELDESVLEEYGIGEEAVDGGE